MDSTDQVGVKSKRFVPRGLDREAQLLDAAIELLTDRGYDSFTIDELAVRAGASKATIYRRWKSKAEIIGDAVQRTVRMSEADIDTGSLRGDLVELYLRVQEEIRRIPEAARGLVMTPTQNPDLLESFDERFRNPSDRALERAIERGRERGEIPKGMDPWFIRDITLPVLIVRTTWGEPVDRAYVERIVDEVFLPAIQR